MKATFWCSQEKNVGSCQKKSIGKIVGNATCTKGNSLYILDMQRGKNSTKFMCLSKCYRKKRWFMHVAPKFKHLNYRTLHEYSNEWTLGLPKLTWYCEVCNIYLIVKQAWRGSIL